LELGNSAYKLTFASYGHSQSGGNGYDYYTFNSWANFYNSWNQWINPGLQINVNGWGNYSVYYLN
jgi:hypothetical protein